MAFFAALLFVVVCFNTDFGASEMMTVTPQTFTPGVTPNITMTCEPDGVVQQEGVHEFFLIEITKGENVYAIVRPGTPATLDRNLNPSKYSAVGLVDKADVPNSYLHFYINFPTVQDSGVYQCVITYLDQSDLSQSPKERFELMANASQEVNFQKQLDNAQQMVSNLMARVDTLEAQVFNLTTVSKNHSAELSALKDRAQLKTGFYATLSNKLDVHVNDVLVFDDVRLNNGDAYNATSGVFVAPVSGHYVFSLVLEVEAATAVKMDVTILVDSDPISRLFAFGGDSFQAGQTSGSVLYKVNAGSQVKVVVAMVSMETESLPRLVNERLSYFAGFLA